MPLIEIETECLCQITNGNLLCLQSLARAGSDYWNTKPQTLIHAAVSSEQADILIYMLECDFVLDGADVSKAYDIVMQCQNRDQQQTGLEMLLVRYGFTSCVDKVTALAVKDCDWNLLRFILREVVPEASADSSERRKILLQISPILCHEAAYDNLCHELQTSDLDFLLKFAATHYKPDAIEAVLNFCRNQERIHELDISAALMLSIGNDSARRMTKLIPYVADQSLDIGFLNSFINYVCRCNIAGKGIERDVVEIIPKTQLCDNLDLHHVLEHDRADMLQYFIMAKVDILTYIEKCLARDSSCKLSKRCAKYVRKLKAKRALQDGLADLVTAVQNIMQAIADV